MLSCGIDDVISVGRMSGREARDGSVKVKLCMRERHASLMTDENQKHG